MTSLRNELEQLINYAISSEETEPNNHLDLPRMKSHPGEYYPEFMPQLRKSDEELQRDPLFRLQQQKFSIQSTMEFLKRQFEEGKINDESFFKQYRSLTRELYLVEARIRDLATRMGIDESRYLE